MKVALVYDRVNKVGGAERVLQALHEVWPEAPLYTAVYNPKTAPWARDFEVRPSFLQGLPFARSRHEWLAWVTGQAFERFDFSGFDVVISVTSAEAKFVVTPPKTLHICYCLTPTRYLWSGKSLYEQDGIRGWGLQMFGPLLRARDFEAAQRPDLMVAISKTAQKRIAKYYRRESEVIYPPVDTDQFGQHPVLTDSATPGVDSYYLVVSRLVAYKKVDVAIEAFNRLGKPLIIVGTGEEEKRLKRLAKANVSFVSQLTDEELVRYYRGCRAVVFPGEEDFGLVSLEAQAAGKPVVAFGKGGVTETVQAGKTGEFFAELSPQALATAVKKVASKTYKSEDCRRQAAQFSQERFKTVFRQFVEEQWQQYQKQS